MRIVVVGSTHPYRGGISHYNTIMCKILSEKHEVRLVSFRRLFPSWLYPGRRQTDEESTFLLKFDVSFYLDSLNPFSWLNAAISIRKMNPELLIFQWWTPLLGPIYFILSFLIKLRRKIKILFLCHNVIPHEHHFFDRFFSKIAFAFSDYFIVHSREEVKELERLKRNPKVKRINHPIYDIFKTTFLDKEEAKKRLGIHGDIILFFGFIRSYKGLTYLIEAIPKILEKMNITLLIVGEFWEEKDKYLQRIEELNIENHVKIIDAYVPNEDVGVYFSASDLVVLPYVSATQSGIVQIAYAFNVPVLTTSVGGLADVVKDGITGYVVEPKNPEGIAKSVLDFFENDREDLFKINIGEEKRRFSWEYLVSAVEELCSEDGIK